MREDKTQGKRIYVNDPNEFWLAKGEYGREPETGIWYANSPNGHVGNLSNHTVTEHDDGTITVSPSILISTTVGGVKKEVWHGYLEHGVWREV